MSNDAQVTIMLYSGLTTDEESKLQAIEKGVVSHVTSTIGNVRPLWQSSSPDGARVVQLCVPTNSTSVIWQATTEQLATMSSGKVLAALRQ